MSCQPNDHSLRCAWKRFRQWRKMRKEEAFLRRWGWELFQGKWIHQSGENKYPLTREEAIEHNAKIRNHHVRVYP